MEQKEDNISSAEKRNKIKLAQKRHKKRKKEKEEKEERKEDKKTCQAFALTLFCFPLPLMKSLLTMHKKESFQNSDTLCYNLGYERKFNKI